MASQEFLNEQKLGEYLAAIDQKITAAGQNTWDCLSAPERTTVIAHFLALEISNGGFEKFFVNPAGDRWRETRDALKTVGAVRVAAMFDEALSIFPDGTPSTDQLTRCRQYEEAGNYGEWLMDRLFDEYLELEHENCLYQKTAVYAIAISE